MLDRKVLRNDFEAVADRLANRGVKREILEQYQALDQKRRQLIVKAEEDKKLRNQVSQEIAQLKRIKKMLMPKLRKCKN